MDQHYRRASEHKNRISKARSRLPLIAKSYDAASTHSGDINAFLQRMSAQSNTRVSQMQSQSD